MNCENQTNCEYQDRHNFLLMENLLIQRHAAQQGTGSLFGQQRSGITNCENETNCEDQDRHNFLLMENLMIQRHAAQQGAVSLFGQQRSDITNQPQMLRATQQAASLAQQGSAIAQEKPQYDFISRSNNNLSDYQASLLNQQQILQQQRSVFEHNALCEKILSRSNTSFQASMGNNQQQVSSKRIQFSNRNLRLIIGKNGETIKHIQTLLGVKTQIIRDMDADLDSQCRSLELTGNPMQIGFAEKLIMDVHGVAESGSEYFFVQVPNNKIACVRSAVGNVRIVIYPLQYDHTANSLWISGSQEHVEAAKKLVLQILSRNCPGDWNCSCSKEILPSNLLNKFRAHGPIDRGSNLLKKFRAHGLTDRGLDGPERIFVGGFPYNLTEMQIREWLESFGALREFEFVKDCETGNSKGYAFCVYQDLFVTDIACAALNGIKMGDKTLTVTRYSI